MIDYEKLREDLKQELYGAAFGGGFGGAMAESWDRDNASNEELIHIAERNDIDPNDYEKE